MCPRKFCCAVLILVLSLSFAIPVTSYATGNFPDTTGHWAERFISRAYSMGIVAGYPGGSFQPDKSVTRAEFVSMVNKSFGITGSTNTVSFNDVSYLDWYYNSVLAAASSTYANLDSNGNFRPNDPITREEAAVMLSNLLPSNKKKGNLKAVKDFKSIDPKALSAFEKLNGRNYMGAYSDGNLHPKDPLTRAQIAKILCDVLDNETIVTQNAVINVDKTKLSEKIYTHDVIISSELREGSATIDNCVILGDLIIKGGGNGTITLNNSRISYVSVNKDKKPVRIDTKGNTTIASLSAKQASVIQSAGKNGTGVQKVTVNFAADVTLRGSFPIVNVDEMANVNLETGSIATLTVNKNARRSDITLSGKAKIAEATVNSESYFHGKGVITHMSVNADDITYETRPEKMTVAVYVKRAKGEADVSSDVDVIFKPSMEATDVELDTVITVSFDTAMRLANDSVIGDSNIGSFLTLTKDTRSGPSVDFTATINSAKKVITIIPNSNLSANSRYYITLTANALKNVSGNKNWGTYRYFTTGTKASSNSSYATATFSPGNGATGVSASVPITISLSAAVVKYIDTTEVTPSYLQECIQFKTGSSSGTSVPFTASISSANTITITPSTSLTAGQTYYLAIVANKLKSMNGGKAVSAASSTWTVLSTSTPVSIAPVLGALKLTPAENSIDIGFTPNVSGTVYTLATTNAAVTDTQIMAGKSAAATANTEGTLSITGLSANTKYYVYALLQTPSSSKSAIVSASTTTTIVDAKLNTLTLASSGGINLLNSFDPKTNTYSVEVPYRTTSVDVSASAEASAVSPVIKINGTTAASLSAIPVSGSSANKITLTISASNKTTATYVINVTVAGNTALQNISVNGGTPTWIDSAYASYIPSTDTSATVVVTTVDTTATIKIGGSVGTGSCTGTVPLGSGNQTITFTVTSNGYTKNYTIQFFR